MKQSFLFLLLLCFGAALQAQSDKAPPVVFSQAGEAYYLRKARADSTELAPFSSFDDKGILVLAEGATVGLYYDKGYKYLTGPGTFKVKQVLKSSNLDESELITMLGQQIEKAMNPYFGPAGFGFGNKPPPVGQGPGHGNKEAAFVPVSPLEGKVTGGTTVTFTWEPKLEDFVSSMPFNFTLRDDFGEELLSKKVEGFSAVFPVTELGLVPGNEYSWEASVTQGDVTLSTLQIAFTYAGASGVEAALQKVKADQGYQAADLPTKLIMEAVGLDGAGFATEAMELLEVASARFPENKLVARLLKSIRFSKGLAE